MKIKFKNEECMNAFAVNSGCDNVHNTNLVRRFGMNEIEVSVSNSDFGLGNEWYDILDSNGEIDFTINVKTEGHFFEIVG